MMQNLEILDLRNNEILSCEPLIYSDFGKLKKLDLSNNLITNFSPLIRLKTMKECYLQNNPCSTTSFMGRANSFEKVRLPIRYLKRIKEQCQPIGYLNFIAKTERKMKRFKYLRDFLSMVSVKEEFEEEMDDFSWAVISEGPYA
jgi:Leucine-rich repeat (LRR) protein